MRNSEVPLPLARLPRLPRLRRRLAADFGCPTDHDVNRHGVMQRLLRAYENEGPRRRVACAGRPLDPALAQQLLQALRATPWHQIPNERRSVRATKGIEMP